MTETAPFNIRCWYYTEAYVASDPLIGLIASSQKGYIGDLRNKPSEDEINNGCYGIVLARSFTGQVFAHAGEIFAQAFIVKERVDVSPEDVWGPIHAGMTCYMYRAIATSQIKCIDDVIRRSDLSQTGLRLKDRPAVMAYLLDQG